MSRRNKNSNVRGPNSALTEFLRVEGITETFRRRRNNVQVETVGENEPEAQQVAQDQDVLSEGSSSINAINVDEDDEFEQIRIAARQKRKAAGLSDESEVDEADSDDDDDDDFVLGNEYEIEGQQDECIECGRKFKLTAYSRYDKLRKGYYCDECNEEIKIQERNKRKNQMSARRRRKRVAQALLNKTTVKLPLLQDVCIDCITKNIEQVESLGDIGNINLTKISQILSKNRSLNDLTIPLFLNRNLTSLQFWDCSNVDSDSYNKIASYCPDLQNLTLFMCGQLHNDNLTYFSDKFRNLTELNLNGPFLISDSMWQQFFETGGSKLNIFEIRNTHRFGNVSLQSLLENCGRNLVGLKLSRLDGIDNKTAYESISQYLSPNILQHLEISYPKSENLIQGNTILDILSKCQESLLSLNLDGCSDLDDGFTKDFVEMKLNNLKTLSLKNLDLVKHLDFSKFSNGGLNSINLSKCIDLDDMSVYSILAHSCETVVELSLNSIEVSKDLLWQIFTPDDDELKQRYSHESDENSDNSDNSDDENSVDDSDNDEESPEPVFYRQLKFPNLTTLDLGFVRAVDDQILHLLSENCGKLKYLEVFGNNRCTHEAKVRKDLIIIGRQGDLH